METKLSDKLSTPILARASVQHKPLFQHCDNTGRRYTEAELEQRAASAYAGRVLVEIFIGSRKLIEFNVTALRGKTELYAKLPQEGFGDKKRNAFNLDVDETETVKKLALHTLRTEKIETVEL